MISHATALEIQSVSKTFMKRRSHLHLNESRGAELAAGSNNVLKENFQLRFAEGLLLRVRARPII